MSREPVDVLLVEDDDECADLVKIAAQMADVSFRFHVVTNGVEALDFLYQREPHNNAPRPALVLLDLNLPLLSGRDVLAEMKADHSLRDIPVALLSTTDCHESIKNEFDLSDDWCYTKPDHFEDYVNLLKRFEDYYWTGRFAPRDRFANPVG